MPDSKRVIYRFHMPDPQRITTIQIPLEAVLTDFQVKGTQTGTHRFSVWFMLNPDGLCEPWDLTVVPTGQPWDADSFTYLRSCNHLCGGDHYFWHLLRSNS